MSPWVSVWFLQAQSDERLLAAARLGHDRAFETLVQRYRKPLLAHARRVLSNARAEDAVQQGLLQAWTALRGGDEVRNAKAWLYRIVHNAALDMQRRSQNACESHGNPEPRTQPSDSELERRFAAQDALAALATLPQTQREVLLRTAIAGDTHEQVACSLGLSEGAVRGLIY